MPLASHACGTSLLCHPDGARKSSFEPAVTVEWNASVDHERQAHDETALVTVAQETGIFDDEGLDVPLLVSGVDYAFSYLVLEYPIQLL